LPGTLRYVAQSRTGRITVPRNMDAESSYPEATLWAVMKAVATKAFATLNTMLDDSDIGGSHRALLRVSGGGLFAS
jgi:hypothetical protein